MESVGEVPGLVQAGVHAEWETPANMHFSTRPILRLFSRMLVWLFSLGLAVSCAKPLPAVPRSGILFTSDRDGNWEIYWMETDGTLPTRLTTNEVVDESPAWSADGSQIAFRSRRDGSSDIFVMDSTGENLINLVKDAQDSFDDEFYPRWHPDGSQLIIYTDRFQPPLGDCPLGRGLHHLAFLPVDGDSEQIAEFDALPGEQQSADWSPDGKLLAFSSNCSQPVKSIYTWNAASGQLNEVVGSPYDSSDPSWSPDGRWLAFVSAHTGNSEIYLLDLRDDSVIKLTNHPAQDTSPTWSPDSQTVAFDTNRDGNREIYLVHINGTGLTNLSRHPAEDWSPAWSPVTP